VAATWTTSATSGVDTTSDTGVGGAAVEGEVNEGADTGAERGGGDAVILRRFGAHSPSPPTVSPSLPRLSSRSLFVVVSTTTEVVGAAARSPPLTMDGAGAGAASEGGTDVDEDGKECGSDRGGGASRGSGGVPSFLADIAPHVHFSWAAHNNTYASNFTSTGMESNLRTCDDISKKARSYCKRALRSI
jgi:hypothetical protein